jgi:hypothetical protein
MGMNIHNTKQKRESQNVWVYANVATEDSDIYEIDEEKRYMRDLGFYMEVDKPAVIYSIYTACSVYCVAHSADTELYTTQIEVRVFR